MKSRTYILIATLMVAMLLITGCVSSIKDVKTEDNVGKTVTVAGTVENPIKLGQLSGFTLVDSEGDKISIKSADLPAEGKKMTVKGTLVKDTIFGYYINVE